MNATRSRASAPVTPNSPSSRHSDRWWLPFVLAGACVLTYWNSLQVPFVLDDTGSIVGNPQIREWWRLSSLLSTEHASPIAGRPVVALSLAINYALGGLAVRGYHLWNLAVHAACALLMFAIVRRTLEWPAIHDGLRRRSAGIAFAAALIWTVHPLNSEVVDYIVQRTESMMALFYLSTLYASLRALRSQRAAQWQVLAVCTCAMGMACKESMATAPLVVVLYDRVFAFGSIKRAFEARWRLYLALASTWVVLVSVAWSTPRSEAAGFSTGIDSWTYLLNQTVIITRYLALTVWPRSLVAFYGWPLPLTIGDVIPYAALIIGLLLLTSLALVRQPRLGLLGAWFFITLAPASSIVPVATEVGAERRMYLPLVAVTVLAVIGAVRLWDLIQARLWRSPGSMPARWVALAGLSVVCAAFAARTIVRNREYSSSVSLARTIVARRPTSVAHQFLGEQLREAGDHQGAIKELRAAVAGDSMARYPLGLELFDQGKWEESTEQLDAFVRTWHLPYRLVPHWLEPSAAEVVAARTVMARALVKLQRWSAVVEQSRLILEMNPSNAEACGLVGDALFAEQKFDDAAAYYRRYVQLRPNEAGAWTQLGLALAASDKPAEAAAAFRRAVEIDPRNGGAQRNLATALFDSRDADGAAEHAREAVALRPNDPVAHDLLGRVLAVQGMLDEAIREFERSLAIDPTYAEAREDMARIARFKNASTSSRRPTRAPGE